jgi:hypothetical protein
MIAASEIQDATPVEIDTELAEIYVRAYQAEDGVAQIANWLKSAKDALARKVAGERFYSSATPEYVVELEAKLAVARDTASATWALTAPYDAEYVRRGRWTRVYLVDNNGGHVHRTMSCDTCFPSTRFVWLPEYSGRPDAEVIADAGALTCLTCFGGIRDEILHERGVDPTAARTKIEAPARRAARLEREAAKAARDAKAAKAGILDAETGGELRVAWLGGTEVLRTLRTARTWLTDQYDWKSNVNAADVARVVAATAKKEGKDAATVIAEAKQRAARRK